MERLKGAPGLSASGKMTLSGPRGRFSTRVVFGVARPDSLRLEIPSATGLRFLLVSREGQLRADLPGDRAMFEGPATRETMNRLFGIDLHPRDLVAALLGSATDGVEVAWRFDHAQPAEVTIRANRSRLSLTIDDPAVEAPGAQAFAFAPPRPQSWTIDEMSDRLGLVR